MIRSRARRASIAAGVLLTEAVASVTTSPVRTVVNVLGILLGVYVYVATSSIGETLAGQVSAEFQAVQATEMILRQDPDAASTPFTADERLAHAREIAGVQKVGAMTEASQLPVSKASDGAVTTLSVRGVDSEALRIIEPQLIAGTLYSSFHERSQSNVVVLPVSVAERLGSLVPATVVWIDEAPYTVVGIYDGNQRRIDTRESALIPRSVANDEVSGKRQEVLIQIEIGAASVVAPKVRLALSPEDPESLIASTPPEPKNFRRTIEGNITRLTLIMSLVALGMGTLAIANSASAAVYVRTPEIALRSVLGASSAFTFTQLVLETTTLACLAGMVGAAAAVATVQFVGVWQGWAPTIDATAIIQGVFLAMFSGAIAGLGPAVRAVRIQPVEALRR